MGGSTARELPALEECSRRSCPQGHSWNEEPTAGAGAYPQRRASPQLFQMWADFKLGKGYVATPGDRSDVQTLCCEPREVSRGLSGREKFTLKELDCEWVAPSHQWATPGHAGQELSWSGAGALEPKAPHGGWEPSGTNSLDQPGAWTKSRQGRPCVLGHLDTALSTS